MKGFSLYTPIAALLLCSVTAIKPHAAIPSHLSTPTASPSRFTSPWDMNWGIRYWLGSGNYKMNLLDYQNQLLSRLSYEDVISNSAEGFWRLDHQSGVFIKGSLGGGANSGGYLIDQDFPPGIIYSRTSSNQENGAINYFSADLGYDIFNKGQWKVGVFAGYHYWLEHYNSFGCTQTAVNGTICSTPISTGVDALNDNLTWNSLRLGISSSLSLPYNLNLILDAAYTRSYLSANDYHNLRPDIRGIFEDGTGNGAQIDLLLNWAATPRLNVGVGGRWWNVNTDGYAHFDQTDAGGQPQPIALGQNVYGLLFQTSYNFDDVPSFNDKDSSLVSFPWQGFYIGANIGYGTYPSYVNIYPTSPAAAAIEDSTPILLNVQSSGFLGGGQMGYDWQVNRFVLGIESDMDYANVGGANSVLLANPTEYVTTVSKNIEWLGTVRARAGKLASDRMLAYVSGGIAVGETNLRFDQRSLGATCTSAVCSTGNQNQALVGWTAGAGIEYAVSHRMTYKAEYLYVDLGHNDLNTSPNISGISNYLITSNFSSNLLRLGVNYKI